MCECGSMKVREGKGVLRGHRATKAGNRDRLEVEAGKVGWVQAVEIPL